MTDDHMKEKDIPQFKILNKLTGADFSAQGFVDFIQVNKSLKKDIKERLNTVKYHYIKLDDNRVIKAGHVIFRPLANKMEISAKGFNHYAIVIGTTLLGQKLIVDINEKRNVDVDTFENFRLKFPLNLVHVEENDTDLNLILKRVVETQFALYYVDDFNCRHFVTYCVYGKKRSEAVKYLTKQISPGLNAVISYFELCVCSAINEKDQKLFLRSKTFFEKVDQIIKELNQ
ncbi:MAG: hypothetical protein ACXWFB_11940 [Nitrososphaeraceae archaeon]